MTVNPLLVIGMAGALSAAACGGNDAPGETYYERVVQPILVGSCSGNTSGCHSVDDTDQFGFAAGNFDVTSFENVQKRRDLLHRFGAYNVPLLLVKAVGGSGELGVNYRRSGDEDTEFIPLQVQHVGGSVLNVNSDAYLTLLEWTSNGATANGLPEPQGALPDPLPCETFVPASFTSQEQSDAENNAEFDAFQRDVFPILERKGCGAGNCHGAPQADFYITCGDDARQRAFNFSQVASFVDEPASNSQVLQIPLSVDDGGYFHSGGEHFADRDDSDYVTLEGWAEAVGRQDFGEGDAGKQYFGRYVQPLLLTRGCSFEACHSPQATNDFQLRSGSQGFFSSVALERNYEKLRDGFMAMEVPDARRGRAVAKTVLDVFGGIAHRGGPVLETQNSGGAQPSSCTFPLADPTTAPAYCVVQEWVDTERAALIANGEVDALATGDTINVVFVERANITDVAGPLEFHVYQGGSDLRFVPAEIQADGSLQVNVADASLLTGCAGLAAATADVQSPDVKNDGDRVVFAARNSAAENLNIWEVSISTGTCTKLTNETGSDSGQQIHNFNPAYSPDGNFIAYDTTRGGTVTRKHFNPAADIYRMAVDGSDYPGEQMTFLTNSELNPQFMREGRMIMSTEKISEGFYQVSGRRMNWDLTDYHPLLAQRSQSMFGGPPPGDPSVMVPSVGYSQATEIREGFDNNFIFVFSDEGARGGGGTIGIFNRSAGTFEAGRDDPGFLKSVRIPDTAATGRVGSATDGAWRSPFPLLDGRILASYAAGSFDLATVTQLDYNLEMLDPLTGARTTLLAKSGVQLVEAVLAIKKPAHELYYNRRQLVFGGFQDTSAPETAVIHFPDAPLVFTLLNANARRGRPSSLFLQDASQIAFYSEAPAPAGTTSGNTQSGIFQQRQLLGRAPLESDGSVKVRVPSGAGVILELQDDGGNPVLTMFEEHQLGPGENISFGIVRSLFDAVCGGCHGTVSGRELDVFVTPDALTGASESTAQGRPAQTLSN